MRWMYALALAAVIAGTFARVTNIDTKTFHQDEAFTALRISGHRESDYRALFDGKTHPVAQILAYQIRDPQSNAGTVLAAVAAEDPDQGPLFYILERWFVDVAGSSIAAYRRLSVLLGVVAIIVAFVLGRELFGSSLGGATLSGMIAVAPFHVLYSQVARAYELFTVVILAASALVVRAARNDSPRLWIAYGALVAAGMYTDPLLLFVVAAHLTFCAFASGERRLARVRSCAIAAALGIATFVPWAYNGHHNNSLLRSQLSWGLVAFPLWATVQKFGFNLSSVIFDSEFASRAFVPLVLVVFAIDAWAVWSVVRAKSTEALVLGASLALFAAIPFLVLDLVAGTHYFAEARYLTATWIGVEIVVAAAITSALQARNADVLASKSKVQSRVAVAAFAIVVALGSFSAFFDARYHAWWSNNDQVALRAVGERIAKGPPHALVMSEGRWFVPIVLAHYLPADATFVLFVAPKIPALPSNGPVFVVTPSSDVANALAAKARPATLVNVSPSAPPTLIGSFHGTLQKAGVGGMGDLLSLESNALFEIESSRAP